MFLGLDYREWDALLNTQSKDYFFKKRHILKDNKDDNIHKNEALKRTLTLV